MAVAQECAAGKLKLTISVWIWSIWCIIKLYYIGAWSLWKQLREKHVDPNADLPSDLNGRVVIVTGGATGIGHEVTRALVSRKATVIIASKDVSVMEETVTGLKQQYPDAKVELMMLNLASFQSIREFVDKFNKTYEKLHILINNAGIMLVPFCLTEEGYEQQMGVNYLGHLLLTLLLLPKLLNSGTSVNTARVVNVSSSTHLVADTYIDTWFHSTGNTFTSHGSYANSKLAILLATYRMQNKLRTDNSNVTVNAVHPGVVNTPLYDTLHLSVKWIFRLISPVLFKTPSKGADSVLYAALSDHLEGRGGIYIDNSTPSLSSPVSYSQTLQEDLWRKTCQLIPSDFKSSFSLTS